jgi:hypothetical protein
VEIINLIRNAAEVPEVTSDNLEVKRLEKRMATQDNTMDATGEEERLKREYEKKRAQMKSKKDYQRRSAMLHLTIEDFLNMEPCGAERHIDQVRHLFPITTKEGVHELAKLWRHEAETKPIDYHSDLEWITCRILPRDLRLKAAKHSPTTLYRRELSCKEVSCKEASKNGSALWSCRNLSLELIEELLTEVTSGLT